MANVLQNLIEALRRKLIAQDKDILEIIQDDFDLYEIRHQANQGSNSSDRLTHLITVKDYTDEEARKSIEQIIEMAKAGASDWFSILKSQMTERAFQEVIESIAASKESPKLQSEKIIKSGEDVATKFSDSYPKYGIRIVHKRFNGALCGIVFYNRFDPNEEPQGIKFGDRNAESLYMYFLLHPRVDKDNKDILEGWYTIHSKVFPPSPSWKSEFEKNPDVVENKVLADIWKQSLTNANSKVREVLALCENNDKLDYYIINTCQNPENRRRKLYSLNIPKELIDSSILGLLMNGNMNTALQPIQI